MRRSQINFRSIFPLESILVLRLIFLALTNTKKYALIRHLWMILYFLPKINYLFESKTMFHHDVNTR